MPGWLKTLLGILVTIGKSKGVIPADAQTKPGVDPSKL